MQNARAGRRISRGSRGAGPLSRGSEGAGPLESGEKVQEALPTPGAEPQQVRPQEALLTLGAEQEMRQPGPPMPEQEMNMEIITITTATTVYHSINMVC